MSAGGTDTDWQAQQEQPEGPRGSGEPELSRVSERSPLIPSDLEPAAVVQLLGRAPLSSKGAL